MDDNKLGNQAAGEPQDFAGQGHVTEDGLKKEAELGEKAAEKFKQTWEKDLGPQGTEELHDIFDQGGKTAQPETGLAHKFAKHAQAKSRQALAQSQETFGRINQWAHQNPWMMAGAGLIVGLLLAPKRRND